MRPRDKARAKHLSEALTHYHTRLGPLPGLTNAGRLDTLVAQLIDSLRRFAPLSFAADTIGTNTAIPRASIVVEGEPPSLEAIEETMEIQHTSPVEPA